MRGGIMQSDLIERAEKESVRKRDSAVWASRSKGEPPFAPECRSNAVSDSPNRPPRNSRRPYMVAAVLGTALSVFGSAAEGRAAERSVADMGRYCTACWRNARLPVDSWSDCTQD